MGLITEEERHEAVTDLWNAATDEVADAMEDHLDRLNPIYMMANSGLAVPSSRSASSPGCAAYGQPEGEIIERPIKANSWRA